MRRIGLMLIAVLGVGLACKSSPSGNGNDCKTTTASVIIDAQDNLSFSIPSATVSVGQSVCWQNLGSMAHTVTSDPTASDTTWHFEAQLNPNYVVISTFSKVNVDYSYHCRFHQAQGMTGVIHVR